MIAFFSFVIQNALLVSVFPQAPLAVDRMDFACAVKGRYPYLLFADDTAMSSVYQYDLNDTHGLCSRS